MKMMSWNVNSVRVRKDRLLALLERHQPDVLCLQELKTQDPGFPFDAVRSAGYHAVTHGQKTYNGVALLTRIEGSDVRRGLGDEVEDPQARLIAATVLGVKIVNVYVPNGGELGSEKWAYKQAFYARLRAFLGEYSKPSEPLVLCGDFNVATDERDVNVKYLDEWRSSVLFSDEARALLLGVVGFGLVDTFRQHTVEGEHFSWWDYRAGGFPRNNGLRIDYVFATSSLASTCTAAGIDRDERKGEGPSDHAPVWAEFSC